MTSRPLSSFPFLTPEEFRSICSSFAKRVNAFPGDVSALGWTSIKHDEQDGTTVLKISKTIDTPPSASAGEAFADDENPDDVVIEEDDPELFIRPEPRTAEAEYNIILSPSYQVPVLHFFLRGSRYLGSNALELIYEYLVPSAHHSDLKHIGIMGGVSMTNHPISGIPVYFIHPCNTAAALEDVAGHVDPSMETYLPLWLGLVGNCVGLYIPKELFAFLGGPSSPDE